ncbi:hypothetical protein [Haloarcula halophila]|uniref:hypothetical protein n=1 Tax=Halomicroarcula sp. GCM10025335 TaxID=3252668 RepID=UPI00360F91B2
MLVKTRASDASHPPTPPATIPTELVSTLNELPPDRLRDVAAYAEEVADHKEREANRVDADQEKGADRPDDLPDDVPSKPTIIIKEINNNRYYYWQWREGDKIRSQYKSPVNSDE